MSSLKSPIGPSARSSTYLLCDQVNIAVVIVNYCTGKSAQAAAQSTAPDRIRTKPSAPERSALLVARKSLPPHKLLQSITNKERIIDEIAVSQPSWFGHQPE